MDEGRVPGVSSGYTSDGGGLHGRILTHRIHVHGPAMVPRGPAVLLARMLQADFDQRLGCASVGVDYLTLQTKTDFSDWMDEINSSKFREVAHR